MILWRVVAVLAGLVVLGRGCQVWFSEDCQSADFHDLTVTCYPQAETGGMSGGLAGLALAGIGIGVLLLGFIDLLWRELRKPPLSPPPPRQDTYGDTSWSQPPPVERQPAPVDPFVLMLASLLKRVLAGRDSGTAGWDAAAAFLVHASDGELGKSRAIGLLLDSAEHDAVLRDVAAEMSEDFKWAVVRASLEIILADDVVTAAERANVSGLIAELWQISEWEARQRLDSILLSITETDDTEKAEALETLGLSGDASTVEIRAAYLHLVRIHHPDRAPEDKRQEANAKTAQINQAYDYLMKGQGG